MSNPRGGPLYPSLKVLSLLLALCFLSLIFIFSRSATYPVLTPNPDPSAAPFDLDFDLPSTSSAGGLRIRPGNRSYREYIAWQLNKTLDPRLRRLWTTRDWDRKVAVFSSFFRRHQSEGLLHNSSRALCVGARTGQEVAALRRVGVADSIGIDLVPSPPLVIAGDFHRQPFPNQSFDFEFSNVFDHALFPGRFVAEMERTLRPGGVGVLHVAIRRRGDRYSANDLFSVEALVALFHDSDLVETRRVNGFGLDTEVVMRKTNRTAWAEEATHPPALSTRRTPPSR